jgi:carbonic anhydrase
MTTLDTLTERNHDFAAHQFAAGLPLMPTLRTLIISCADPRVDPAHVLGLEPGEAIVLRNAGGRVTPATLQMIALLGAIARAEGLNPGSGFTLIVLHHTDCGLTRLAGKPDLLAGYFGVSPADMEAKAVTDPRAAVASDVAVLKATTGLPGNWLVAGLVYDVTTGLVEVVVAPELLRGEGQRA